ncbi:unnamed protein product [Blepharisma stoltei]|uniref:Casein kinase I n=1 Tax=Blepharisma stoltei TaxID=1481888 RepID=A0AAU9JZP9_9CILI|nr:unnamed protein product [Blepharisma stoltei]
MELRVGGKYRVGRKIGSGSFGQIYLGANIQTNEEIAIKLEKNNTRHPQLQFESRIYRILQGGQGIPMIHWYGVEGDYNVLVMDLLGPSLEDLLKFCGQRFSVKTTLVLAEQIISRLEFMHEKNLIHRDVKPDNFLIGLRRNESQIYAIDFGLAKQYRDPRTNQHIPYKEGKSLTGTARYASIFTHMGIEQSRRDDLEGLGYVLMYFLRGSLPWQGLQGNNRKEKYRNIMDRKINTPVEVLCEGFPVEFVNFINYARALRFDERPDYGYLKRLFKDEFMRQNYQQDFLFDWQLVKRKQETQKSPEGQEGQEARNQIQKSPIRGSPMGNRGATFATANGRQALRRL